MLAASDITICTWMPNSVGGADVGLSWRDRGEFRPALIDPVHGISWWRAFFGGLEHAVAVVALLHLR